MSEAPSGSAAAPERAGLVLITLILVAAVANLNLAVANVALPDIGIAFDASQTELNLVAVGYSLGLAASVLYLGALGDRYGRKLLLIVGTLLAIPASLLAPSRRRWRCCSGPGCSAGSQPNGIPDDPLADHGAVVGACEDEVDRALVGPRWSDLGARALLSGALLLWFD
jgi:Major Facilitator Superfamily